MAAAALVPYPQSGEELKDSPFICLADVFVKSHGGSPLGKGRAMVGTWTSRGRLGELSV
jgi:hypothetical protein